MTVVERFTTNGLGRSERLDFWNRLTDETYPGTRVDMRGAVFEAGMLRWTLGELTMIRPRSRGSIVQRQNAANAPERIVLHLQHSGRSLHRQRGREAELAAGDFVLSSANEPYRIDIDDHEFLVIEMPRDGLAGRIPDLDDVISRRIGGQTPGARLLHNFLLSLWQQAEAGLADCDWQADASNVLLDLASFAVRDCRNTPMAAAPLRARIARLVEANLTRPHFSSVEIAAQLGVSVRTVQNAFSQMGTTPAAYILQRRLERAADMLRANPALSVTAVAFDLGFSDSGYFARCFRQHFKTSPSRWRGDTAVRSSAGW